MVSFEIPEVSLNDIDIVKVWLLHAILPCDNLFVEHTITPAHYTTVNTRIPITPLTFIGNRYENISSWQTG
jgi:hypothetical protein